MLPTTPELTAAIETKENIMIQLRAKTKEVEELKSSWKLLKGQKEELESNIYKANQLLTAAITERNTLDRQNKKALVLLKHYKSEEAIKQGEEARKKGQEEIKNLQALKPRRMIQI